MLRGLYNAASGMISLERKQEALSNNLANVQTPGFKKDDTVLRAFPKLLIQRIQDLNDNGMPPISGAPRIPGQPAPIGELYNGVYAQERIPNFHEGPLVQTEQPLDIAVNDQGIASKTINGRQVKPAAFFAVQLPNGQVGYTRNGKWDLDANGHLVTSEGYLVLDRDRKPIQISDSVAKGDVHISGDGVITVPTQISPVGEIGIALVNNPYSLRRAGTNVYQADNPAPFIQDPGITNPGVSLQQGFIEQSNVDPGQTMADMMMAVRGYEANQKVIGVYDQSLQQLYTVGKLEG
jgi:flagellar basal-body rod protein FlgF